MSTYICEYSMVVPRQGVSNEFPQHMFTWRNKKNISSFWLKKVPHVELILESLEKSSDPSRKKKCLRIFKINFLSLSLKWMLYVLIRINSLRQFK